MDLPLIEFKLSEDVEGLQAIALVDSPAIGVQYQAFAPHKFEVINEDKRIVMGAAMIPDLPIYRRDERGEYYAVFKKNTIKDLVQKYFKEGKQNNFNEQHDSLKLFNDVYIYQSFITDEELGIKAPEGFEDIADGTWFIAAKVENDEAWDKIKKEGLLRGFSVEGVFELEKYQFNKMNKINLENVISTLKSVFADAEVEETTVEENFGEATLTDGTIVKWEGELKEGTALVVVTPEGEISAPDGNHELEDGTIVETAGGLVVSIVAIESEDAPEVEEVEAEVENEFNEEMLNEMLERAVSKYAEAINESIETIKAENESLRTELASAVTSKEELKQEFASKLEELTKGVEELATSEEPTSKKPQEFKALTRAEKAAKLGAAIRANKK